MTVLTNDPGNFTPKIPPRLANLFGPVLGDSFKKLTRAGAEWMLEAAIYAVCRQPESPIALPEMLDNCVDLRDAFPDGYFPHVDDGWPSFIWLDSYPNQYEYLILAAHLARELREGHWMEPGLGSVPGASAWLDEYVEILATKSLGLTRAGLLWFLEAKTYCYGNKNDLKAALKLITPKDSSPPLFLENLKYMEAVDWLFWNREEAVILNPSRPFSKPEELAIIERLCYEVLLGIWTNLSKEYLKSAIVGEVGMNAIIAVATHLGLPLAKDNETVAEATE